MSTAIAELRVEPPADRLVTAEELLQHPEWGPCELVHGKVLPVCRPNNKHGVLMTELAIRVGGFVKARNLGRVFSGDSGVLIERHPDTVRGPDLFFVRFDRFPKGPLSDGFFEAAPDLCIEITSPNDKWADIEDKVEMYRGFGVELIWVFDPRKRQVHVIRRSGDRQIVRRNESLSGENILPEFTLNLEELFSVLD